jgi:predicted nucleic acid-binding protein
MRAERVLDASVLGAALFSEVHTDRALAKLVEDFHFIAPDLLFVEMASLASKKVRRGHETRETGERALDAVAQLVSETIAARDYAARAFAFAADHGFSAYDGLYLAIAEGRGAPLLTADQRLVQRARDAGLSALVEPL